MSASPSCTLVINHDKFHVPQLSELKAELESKDDERIIEAVKQAILLMLNGEPMPRLLMTVIQYCIHTENHELKKLLMYYWEVVQKYDADGNLLPEMILVCNALRNDLISANEFIRGTTLRFLCHVTDREILGPLVPTILENLSHRHHYVRRNAVLTVHSVYQSVPDLIPEAAAEIVSFLAEESDGSARRNAFFMLYNADEKAAMTYFASIADDASHQPEGLQLAILEFARKVCRSDPRQKGRFIAVIFGFLSSSVPAVAFEAASTVVSLSTAPTAIRAAAQTFTNILVKESDNNIKLIVLERLTDLKRLHPKVMREIVMDVMRVLASPNLDIRKKTLAIVLDLVSPRNVEEVVNALKKEILKSQEKAEEKSAEYRELLVSAVHTCVTKFPEVAEAVVQLLMEFLSTDRVAKKVIRFVREIVEAFPGLRGPVLDKLTEQLPEISESQVIRSALWVLGEYCEEWERISATLVAIRQSMGTLPLVEPHVAAAEAAAAGEDESKTGSSGPKVLADGSYASQSAAVDSAPADSPGGKTADLPIRQQLMKGNYFIGSAIAATLTKLALRTAAVHGATSDTAKAVTMDALLVMSAILELGQSKASKATIDQDSQERIVGCMRALGDPATQAAVHGVLLGGCRQAFKELAAAERESKKEAETEKEPTIKAHADQLITVRQLHGGRSRELSTMGLDDEADLIMATGATKEDFASRLRRVHQLTGFADPVYAEAVVLVHDYDITLEMLIINRTSTALKDLGVELATVGDLKLVDHPQSYVVPVGESVKVKSNIKVSSTESGHIYGTIVYQPHDSDEKVIINLNDIHIDIMDYIHPASCTDIRFREMWAEFEWENKVMVNTNITDLRVFVEHMVKTTNMACLTPPSALTGECNFLAANMYARSTFGEDALANLSIEIRPGDSKIKGHIRIRSKTQGVALSLGERITARMKI